MRFSLRRLLPCLALLLLTTEARAAINIVANPGFEASNIGLPSWSTAGGGITVNTNSANAHTGNNSAFFQGGSTTGNDLSQVLTTTTSATYDLDFWFRFSSPGETGNASDINDIVVKWDGSSILHVQNFNQNYVGPGSGGHFVFSGLTASSGSTNLEFIVIQPSGRFIVLDDVTVTQAASGAVPEPTSIAIWGLGALSCAVAGYRRRKTA